MSNLGKFGYNDPAHFLVKNRSHYFKKVKEVWTASRKHSRIRVNSKKMFSNLKRRPSSRPTSINHTEN